MKKVLFILVSVIMCLSSCKRVPADVMRADFMYAFADYEYRESHLNCECVKRVYDAKGEYILDANKLTDSLTIVMDKAASECFDSLYIKYGDEVVSDMVKRSKGVYLPNKEAVYRYYVDGYGSTNVPAGDVQICVAKLVGKSVSFKYKKLLVRGKDRGKNIEEAIKEALILIMESIVD